MTRQESAQEQHVSTWRTTPELDDSPVQVMRQERWHRLREIDEFIRRERFEVPVTDRAADGVPQSISIER